MNPLMRMGMQAPQTGPPPDTPQVDTAEQVQISSLALLKMLKHGAFFFVVYRFPREKIFRLFGHARKCFLLFSSFDADDLSVCFFLYRSRGCSDGSHGFHARTVRG